MKSTIMIIAVFASIAAFSANAAAETGPVDAANRKALATLQAVKENYAASLRMEAIRSKNPVNGVRVTGPASLWLKKVNPDQVNMVTNRFYGSRQEAISIGGRDYYISGAYAFTLRQNPSIRFALDPLTERKVDKSAAMTYADASGRVFYFESEDTFRNFIGLASPGTIYGYYASK